MAQGILRIGRGRQKKLSISMRDDPLSASPAHTKKSNLPIEGRPDRKLTSIIFGAFAILVGFLYGIVTTTLYLPFIMHGDTAAMQVLADAILEEGSLLPTSFQFGNQIMLFRSSPFIAAAMFAGLDDTIAFSVGTALSLAFWSGVLFTILTAFLKSPFRAFFCVAFCLVPLASWEADYILGQQSHLANCVLAAGAVLLSVDWVKSGKKRFLAWSSICLLLISIEEPLRAILVAVPLCLLILFSLQRRTAIAFTATLGFSVLFGFAMNAGLKAINSPSVGNYGALASPRGPSEVLEILAHGVSELFFESSTASQLIGHPITAANILNSTLSIAFSAVFAVAFFYWLAHLFIFAIRFLLHKDRTQTSRFNQFNIAALISISGILIGALAVTMVPRDSPDNFIYMWSIRHYLWAIFLLKLIIIMWASSFLGETAHSAFSGAIGVIVLITGSFWAAFLIRTPEYWESFRLRGIEAAYAQARHPLTQAVMDVANDLQLSYAYGNFWDVMPLNSLAHGVSGVSIGWRDSGPEWSRWLARRTSDRTAAEALYVVSANDNLARDWLAAEGGRLIRDFDIGSDEHREIWLASREWAVKDEELRTGVSSLGYFGPSLIRLRSSAGVFSDDSISTNGVAGALLYGPYALLHSGEYTLTVFGTVTTPAEARVDVTGSSGDVVFFDAPINSDTAGVLLGPAPVMIPADSENAEVRIWVTEASELQVTGYSLTPSWVD